jgi:hypothetical protein
VWLRLFDREGNLLPTEGETGRSQAAELEEEVSRLNEELRRLRGLPE